MKNYLLLVFVASLFFQALTAQDSLQLKKITLKAKITRPNGSKEEGFIQQVTDTSVVLSSVALRFGTVPAQNSIAHQTPYQNINTIIVRNRYAPARGFLIGALSGVLIGVTAALVEGSDPHGEILAMTAGEKALAYGLPLGAVGGGIGAIIGALTKKTFVIGGHKQEYDKMKENVLDRAYRQP